MINWPLVASNRTEAIRAANERDWSADNDDVNAFWLVDEHGSVIWSLRRAPGSRNIYFDAPPTYRIYSLDSNGRIVSCQVLHADTDATASAKARSLATLYPVELWERTRYLGRFDPDDTIARG